MDQASFRMDMQQSNELIEPHANTKIAPVAEALQAWLVAKLAHDLQIEADQIDPRDPFANLGLDSLAAVSLSSDLEDLFGRQLSPTLVWDYPSIEALARHLAESIDVFRLDAVRLG